MQALWSDARHFQIAALSSLLAVNFIWIDFGARPLYSALAISSALLTQIVCSRLFGLPQIDLRSPLITGLSLSLLLRANEPWLPAIAGVFGHRLEVLAANRRSGTFSIPPVSPSSFCCWPRTGVWISPGQWGNTALADVAGRLPRHSGVAGVAARRTWRCSFSAATPPCCSPARYWLGDPLAIPLHQLQSGSLLIFAFFMISDPRTTPDSRLGTLLLRLGGGGLCPLSRIFHADPAGALFCADRALSGDAPAQPD